LLLPHGWILHPRFGLLYGSLPVDWFCVGSQFGLRIRIGSTPIPFAPRLRFAHLPAQLRLLHCHPHGFAFARCVRFAVHCAHGYPVVPHRVRCSAPVVPLHCVYLPQLVTHVAQFVAGFAGWFVTRFHFYAQFLVDLLLLRLVAAAFTTLPVTLHLHAHRLLLRFPRCPVTDYRFTVPFALPSSGLRFYRLLVLWFI